MIFRWKRWLGGFLFAVIAVAISILAVVETGIAERWARHLLVRQIEQKTGARVEINELHLHLWRLQAEIEGLTLHGLEASGMPPLFHADRIDVAIRILSLLGHQIVLKELVVERPEITVGIAAGGASNVPKPQLPVGNRPWRDTLFNLRVGHLELRDGNLVFNDRQVPLAIRGQNLEFVLTYDAAAAGGDSYVGNLGWQQAEMTERRSMPFRFDISAKFTLHRDAFELDELVCTLPHSVLNLRAELPSFEQANWNLRYRGRLSLADVRRIFRAPNTPEGTGEFSGQAHYKPGSSMGGGWTASGYYNGRGIRMPYQWFHASNLETWGDYEITQGRLVVPNLKVHALGGTVDGRLEMKFKGLTFRTETHLQGVRLADALAAVDNPNLPVNTLHWDGLMDVHSVNTWDNNFQHFRSKGESRWSPPLSPSAATIPASAQIEYDYSQDRKGIAISPSQITTPKMQLNMEGFLGAADSALEVRFRAGDLLDWNDFINIIRGSDAIPRRIAGSVLWNGRILGPIVGPTFIGHMHLADARYDRLSWDNIEGDLEYSPDGFHLTKTVVQLGRTSANVDLFLQFDNDWSFLPASSWTLNARIDHASSDDLQAVVGTNYRGRGILSGDVRGSGTRGAPILDSNFVFEDIQAAGLRFDRLTGQLHVAHDEVRFSHADLRANSGRISGDFLYHPYEQEATFDLAGTAISLNQIAPLQSAALPIAGEMNFHLKGSGPLRSPVTQGDLRLLNLKLGTEMEGNFSGQIASDGQRARITLTSELEHGKLEGSVTVGFAGDQPIAGQLTVAQFDLDPLIVAGLHLRQLTGHSSADGTFTISGALRQPDSIEIKADITRISFDYELVQLTNDRDIQLAYRRNEIRVEEAHLHGTDTDLQINGSARFDRDRPLHFTLSGSANLGLLKGFLPDLVAQGRADANVSVQGTVTQPQVTGRASVRDASVHYADFPVGLSKVNGDVVFDKSRLVFDRITAESGGGQLALSGSVTYGEGPMRYEVSANTSLVRIRYPAGMSWLAGGTLELSGTNTAALVSGHVQVQRLLFAGGVDLASFFASASETNTEPSSSSTFLQNLTFDVAGQTNPGARIEWTGAEIDMDGDVRLRGTWDRPVLLGNIHLLSGQMPFRGNTFQITRGDINFANPFRLDPVLNVEATSTISQYQVTVDFSGPASRLTLNYRSDPPLPDSDVIALLALGNPGEESGLRSQSSSSQNYGATALLSEAISSGLGGRIEHLFGISQFRVDPFVAGTATESNAAARITIEQQVKNNLTITYSTNAATSNQYQLIQVEYAVKRDLSVVFLRDINGTYGLDVKWVKHLK